MYFRWPNKIDEGNDFGSGKEEDVAETEKIIGIEDERLTAGDLGSVPAASSTTSINRRKRKQPKEEEIEDTFVIVVNTITEGLKESAILYLELEWKRTMHMQQSADRRPVEISVSNCSVA